AVRCVEPHTVEELFGRVVEDDEVFFFSSRRRHTRWPRDWSSDVCSSDLVDPRAEWAQIYRETWRIQREYFYDSKMHGNDWQAVYEKYHPLLAYVGHRTDLSYLIAMIGGELTVGHSYLTGNGDEPSEERVSVGLLGA